MSTFFLIISSILFISTYGIHMMIDSGDPLDKPMYTREPIMSAIPWISGFILPVVPLTVLTEYNWIAMFFVNLVIVYIIGPTITRGLLERFSSGKGLGKDMLQAFIVGLVTLVVGLLMR